MRAPLVAKLKLKSSGTEFFFMVNHLYRSRADRRHMQATLLNDWASRQTLPVIAVGDYNFDYSVTSGTTDHDEGFDNMITAGVFQWVEPATLIKTQDSSHDSFLDFVFVSKEAKTWAVSSTILVAPGDFPDTNQTSDHRPVRARFNLASSPAVTKQDLQDAIQRLESELTTLRGLVKSHP